MAKAHNIFLSPIDLEHVFMIVYSHLEYAGMIRDYIVLEFHTSRVRKKLLVTIIGSQDGRDY